MIPASCAGAALVLISLGGCIPYAVGSTAQTVPAGERIVGTSFYAIPSGIENHRDSTSRAVVGLDPEVRFGITENTDVGVRLPSLSGVVVTLKRRLGSDVDSLRAAVAVEPGLGIVNVGDHALAQVSLLASGRQRETFTVYGGLRAIQVIPISRYAVSDSPTAGGFLGLRIGTTDFGISPEIAVYYDKSALGLRSRNVIFVPSVTVHGRDLLRMLGL